MKNKTKRMIKQTFRCLSSILMVEFTFSLIGVVIKQPFDIDNFLLSLIYVHLFFICVLIIVASWCCFGMFLEKIKD